jgi:endo-1,4-beta-xylanase
MTKSIGINADAAGEIAETSEGSKPTVSRRLLITAAAAGSLFATGGMALPADAKARVSHHPLPRHPAEPLWRVAAERGLAYGSSTATWQVDDDAEYAALFARQAKVLFTEDDLLWYRVKPKPGAKLDFSYADSLFARAERNHQLVVGAHLAWDEGFGEGWDPEINDDPRADLWALSKEAAESLLYGTARAMVRRYRGRVAGWIVANEVTSPIRDGGDLQGLRQEVPWYATIGPEYVARMFRLARRHDPHATLILNEFGFETINEYGDQPLARQEAILSVIDTLQRAHVPLDAIGIQAHLLAAYWDSFDPRQYRRFLKKISDRGLKILITEMDVLDDGLPAGVAARDRGVADIYAEYLDTTLANPAVKALITFGLSDRYTWLQEDYPRDDEAGRRPLPFDEDLQRKPAYRALRRELHQAPFRRPLWPRRRSEGSKES